MTMSTDISNDRRSQANIAGHRACLYGMLTAIINTLPGQDLLSLLDSPDFLSFTDTCRSLDNQNVVEGLTSIGKFSQAAAQGLSPATLTELGIDRTRLFRAYGIQGFMAPHEGNYTERKNGPAREAAIHDVVEFYRAAGLAPSEDCREAPDYISIQLDFMRMLCLREKEQWLTNQEVPPALSLELIFFQKHIGQWLGKYCDAALAIATTDFYKGLLCTLKGLVETEKDYLDNLPIRY